MRVGIDSSDEHYSLLGTKICFEHAQDYEFPRLETALLDDHLKIFSSDQR